MTITGLEAQFDQLVEEWENATCLHSNMSIIMRHDAIDQIIKMGESVVPLILKRYRDYGGHWHEPLTDLTKANIKEGIEKIENVPGWVSTNVRIQQLAWLTWGVEQGLLDTTESEVRIVKGFKLRYYGFCNNDSCLNQRERVYQCPNCVETFCHKCTNILHWEFYGWVQCPQCGEIPTASP